MACEIKSGNTTLTQQQLQQLLQLMMANPVFEQSLIFDNYVRMTSKESQSRAVVAQFIQQAFNKNSIDEVFDAVAKEQARRDTLGLSKPDKFYRKTAILKSVGSVRVAIKKFYNKYLTTFGKFSALGKGAETVFEAKGKAIGKISRYLTAATRQAEQLNMAIKSLQKFLTEEDILAITNILNSKDPISQYSLPLTKIANDPQKIAAVQAKLFPIIQNMRDARDEAQKVLFSVQNLLGKQQMEYYMDSLGEYVTTLYEVHRNPNWSTLFESTGKLTASGKVEVKGGDKYQQIYEAVSGFLRENFQKEFDRAKAKVQSAINRINAYSLDDVYIIPNNVVNTGKKKKTGNQAKDFYQKSNGDWYRGAQRVKKQSAIDKLNDLKNNNQGRVPTQSDILEREDKLAKATRDLKGSQALFDKWANILLDEVAFHTEALTLLQNEYKEANSMLGAGNETGKMTTSIFKSKKDLPQELKDFYGYIKNPSVAFIGTLYKVHQAAAMAEYQNKLFDYNTKALQNYNPNNPLTMPIFSPTPDADKGLTIPFTLGNEYMVLRNLLGSDKIYVSEETIDIFKEETVQRLNGVVLYLSLLNTLGKVSKTILSQITQMKNFLANIGGFLVAVTTRPQYAKPGLVYFGRSISNRAKNELSRLKNLAQGKGFSPDTYDSQFLQDELLEKEQRITGSDLIIGDLMSDYESQKQVLSYIEAFLDKNAVTAKLKELATIPASVASEAFQIAARAYRGGDDIFKGALFQIELNTYANVYFGMSYEQLLKTGNQGDIQMVQDKAGSVVRRIVPNYIESNKLSKFFQKYGLNLVSGPFIMFRIEQMRNLMWKLDIMNQEYNSKHPDPVIQKRLRSLGRRRAADIIVNALISSSATAYFISYFFGGMDDDEQEFVMEYAVADYMAVPTIRKTDKGDYEVIDIADYNVNGLTGVLDRFIMDVWKFDVPLHKSAANMIKRLISSFTDKQMATGAIIDFTKTISEIDDSTPDSETKWAEAWKKLQLALEPGTLDQYTRNKQKEEAILKLEGHYEKIQKMYKRELDPKKKKVLGDKLDQIADEIDFKRDVYENDNLALYTGFRFHNFNPNIQIPKKIYDKLKKINKYSNAYEQRVRELSAAEKSPEKEKEIYMDLYKSYVEDLNYIRTYVERGTALGWDIEKLLSAGTLKREGQDITAKNTLISKTRLAYVTGQTDDIPDLVIKGADYGMSVVRDKKGRVIQDFEDTYKGGKRLQDEIEEDED